MSSTCLLCCICSKCVACICLPMGAERRVKGMLDDVSAIWVRQMNLPSYCLEYVQAIHVCTLVSTTSLVAVSCMGVKIDIIT